MQTTSPFQPVLVTGATGHHGGTGTYLVRRLIEEGMPVRVLARRLSSRTEALEELGAKVVVGDLHDRASLATALDEVDVAYFAYPIAGGIVPAAAAYAAAVRQVGRHPYTVVMSMGPAHPDHPSELGQAQWLAEEIMQWAGLDLLILRIAAAFHENIPVLHSDAARTGVIRNSFGERPVAWINAQDAAELAAVALLHPERFADATIHYPPGTEDLSYHKVADILSNVLGARVRFEPVPRDVWREELATQAKANPGGPVNASMAGHISAVGDLIAQRGMSLASDPSYFKDKTGQAPITLKHAMRAHKEDFQTPTRATPTPQASPD
jgi:uncharacterized protein YbjT (DUF2867 family)